MPDLDLDDVSRRPQRYWDIDGLPELTLGLLWILWGSTLLVGEALPDSSIRQVFWAAIPVLLAGAAAAIAWLTRRLKARLTFPRTGYVEWKEPSRAARLSAAVIAMASAGVLAALATRGGDAVGRSVAPLFGLLVALALVAVSVRQRAPHYLMLAAVALASGLVVGALTSGWASANWMFFVLGLASLIVGGLRLARFLRDHPRQAAELP